MPDGSFMPVSSRLFAALVAPLWLATIAACSSNDTSNDATSTGSSPDCTPACTLGVSECTDGGVRTCVEDQGCAAWSEPVACGADEVCEAGACQAKPPACGGKAGSFHSQTFKSGGDDRFYFLHVPKDYDCKKAWPLLVDFHGTGFGSLTDAVEESWAFDEMLEASDTEHFIVVRPRSLPTASTGGYIFQWDLNPGDLERNHDFAVALVKDLEDRYDIDPARVYAMGFSNGPTMAVHFLADDPSIMHGYAAISGGLNEAISSGPMLDEKDAPRVYQMTGFRDYMGVTQRMLDDYLAEHALPADHIWTREADTGHELYGWHYHEAFRWMDQAKKNAPGALASSWERDTTFSGVESLIQLGRDPGGDLHAVGTGGAIYRRHGGAWTKTAALQGDGVALPMTDVCFLPTGQGFAAGDGWLTTTTDGASWSPAERVPEFGAMQFGYTHVTTTGCAGSHLVAGGVWSAAVSDDGGATWSEPSLGQDPPFFTQVRMLSTGTWLGVGYYDVLARSTDGIAFASQNPPAAVQWINAIATGPNGTAWVVGEKGTIFATTDDAQTFVAETAPGTEDLYAVAFSTDGQRGVAVGSHGAAYVTLDAGATWTDRSTGLDGFLGDVIFEDDHTALIVGEGGLVARTTL